MTTPIGSQRRAWRRRLVAACVIAVALGSLVGAATAGAHTPSAESVGRLGSSGEGLDYSKDQAGRLQPLSPDFIAQNLGLSFVSPSGSAGIAVPAGLGSVGNGGSVAAGPPVNPVSTPTLQCVNGHQTADPLSPPCVSQFTGDNGGATWNGVSRNEVRVLVRWEGGAGDGAAPPTNFYTPTDTLVDVDRLPDPDNYLFVASTRLLETYLNKHLQLYGRRLHFFMYFDGFDYQLQGNNAERQRKAALDLLWTVHPFAAVQEYTGGEEDDHGAFLDTLAKNGVVTFQPLDLVPQSRLDRVPDRVWAYRPTVEQMADLYTSYVCRKVVGHPVAISGTPTTNGTPRRLGIVVPAGFFTSGDQSLETVVERRLEACGATIAATATLHPTGGCGYYAVQGVDPRESPAALTDDVRRFQAAGVTTVLWLGCNDQNFPPLAYAEGFRPEWILFGDGIRDQAGSVQADNADAPFDHHAIAVSSDALTPPLPQARCYAVQREADPSLPANPVVLPTDAYAPFAIAGIGVPPPLDVAAQAYETCLLYHHLLQVGSAVQLAGPRLTPNALASGVHGLAYLSSPDPQTPSCFYGSGHACVRDGIAEIYDATAGCFRAIENGRRYLADAWPDGNVDAQITGKEPCVI
ncbi:MAG: hypothetical protein JOZ04_00430 [Acidimicrobiia bacterium]|nr:hypothetical protein [Acidimicrobiia bacterium]